MGSELTAAGILAHVLEACGIRTGTTIDRKDLENMAASLDDQLSALIAAAKRATAAEARVGELEDVRKHAEQLVYIISQWRNGGLRIGACKQAEDNLIEAIARTALKPQEPRP